MLGVVGRQTQLGEDPLRVLRAARFAARFGFAIAPETHALMTTLSTSGELATLAPERVWQELRRALVEAHPERFVEVLRECGALAALLPELDALFGVPQPAQHHPEVDTGAHLLLTVPADRTLWSPHDVSFGHYRRYDRARLAMLWEGLPVRVRLVSYYNTRLYPLIKAARMVGRWRGRALGAAGTDFALPPGFLNRQLTRTMSAESGRLLRVLAGESPEYRRGVSLVAVVRREAGVVPHLFKPASAGPDLYCPGQPEAPLALAT